MSPDKECDEAEELLSLLENGAQKWTDGSIKLLLSLRLNKEKDFNRPICKKTKLWQKISLEMSAKGYAISSADCHLKYRNLLKTYKKNKGKQKESGASTINWQYFDVFDRVLGFKTNINPPADLLGHTISSQEAEIEEQQNEEETVRERDQSDKAEYQPKSKTKNWRADYFDKKLELKRIDIDRKKQEWDERREIEKTRIEAIKDLITALQDLNDPRTSG